MEPDKQKELLRELIGQDIPQNIRAVTIQYAAGKPTTVLFECYVDANSKMVGHSFDFMLGAMSKSFVLIPRYAYNALPEWVRESISLPKCLPGANVGAGADAVALEEEQHDNEISRLKVIVGELRQYARDVQEYMYHGTASQPFPIDPSTAAMEDPL